MRQVRVVTLNFWGTEAPLAARLAWASEKLALLAPDVIGLQEVRPLDGKAGPTTADSLAEALGLQVVFEPSLSWNDDDFFPGHPGGIEGLAILSRFPIARRTVTRLPVERKTERRILLSAEIDAPSGRFWFHTTHLHYRLDDGLAREQQVLAIDEVIRSLGGPCPQILCGDFNAPPDADEIRFLRGLTTLAGRRTHYQDSFLRCHPKDDGFTWSADNEHTRPLRSLDIDRRIDYIFVTTRQKDGRGTIHGADVVLTERSEDDHFASDHFAVMADVQLTADH